MPSFSQITGFTVAIVVAFNGALANPVPFDASSNLVARYADNYVDCTDEHRLKIQESIVDAQTLANYAIDHFDTSSKAWSHYFRTDGAGKDEDLRWANSIWGAVAYNSNPDSYRFSIRCGKEDHPDCQGGSLAVTDARPPQDAKTPREMLICPLFFTADETIRSLSSRAFEKPNRRRDTSWCVANKFRWYEISGFTMLHEMTHLDVVGAKAGVEAREGDDAGKSFKTHGSDDVGGLGSSYPVAARNLAELWQKGREPNGALKPWQNAENLAASTLELYMVAHCEEANYPIGEIML